MSQTVPQRLKNPVMRIILRCKKKKICNTQVINDWANNLESKVVIGIICGPHPLVEILKQWMRANWVSRGLHVPHVHQYLPNNFFVFLFEDAAESKVVLDHGV